MVTIFLSTAAFWASGSTVEVAHSRMMHVTAPAPKGLHSAPAALWQLLLSSAAIWTSGSTVEYAHLRMLHVAAPAPRGLHSALAALW